MHFGISVGLLSWEKVSLVIRKKSMQIKEKYFMISHFILDHIA
jgi:hypothetical protein